MCYGNSEFKSDRKPVTYNVMSLNGISMRYLILLLSLLSLPNCAFASTQENYEDDVKSAVTHFVKTASPSEERSSKLFNIQTFLGSTIKCVQIYPERLEFRAIELNYEKKSAVASIELGCHGGRDKAYVNRKRVGLELKNGRWRVTSVIQ